MAGKTEDDFGPLGKAIALTVSIGVAIWFLHDEAKKNIQYQEAQKEIEQLKRSTSQPINELVSGQESVANQPIVGVASDRVAETRSQMNYDGMIAMAAVAGVVVAFCAWRFPRTPQG
ncbi:hypothetical protein LBMAG48_03460 [Phycisphaerae bacterium]|nr:hypothetical protein LBMAG48_03460 [Phycisphaerae bacterium]